MILKYRLLSPRRRLGALSYHRLALKAEPLHQRTCRLPSLGYSPPPSSNLRAAGTQRRSRRPSSLGPHHPTSLHTGHSSVSAHPVHAACHPRWRRASGGAGRAARTCAPGWPADGGACCRGFSELCERVRRAGYAGRAHSRTRRGGRVSARIATRNAVSGGGTCSASNSAGGDRGSSGGVYDVGCAGRVCRSCRAPAPWCRCRRPTVRRHCPTGGWKWERHPSSPPRRGPRRHGRS